MSHLRLLLLVAVLVGLGAIAAVLWPVVTLGERPTTPHPAPPAVCVPVGDTYAGDGDPAGQPCS